MTQRKTQLTFYLSYTSFSRLSQSQLDFLMIYFIFDSENGKSTKFTFGHEFKSSVNVISRSYF